MIRHLLDRDVLKQSINEFIELVEPKRRSQKEQKERESRINQILIDLHVQLVEPIPTDFLPNNPTEPLTIVPYGELFRVPYNILKDKNGNYFISKHALVFSAAISILRNTHENKVKSTSLDNAKLLAVVNPKPMPKSNFSQLDETEQVFQQLLKFYTGTSMDNVLVGSDATKANLRIHLKSGEHAVVYFGTHGEIDDNDVFNSYIALAKLDRMGKNEDGRLRISDIFGLNLRSDLSILAACGTGRGVVSADGVNGLSRAFVRGGSASLLTSLWTIPEMVSFKHVCEFHQYWRAEGMTKANALRMTQMNDMAFYPDQPEIWAGFQLYGEGE
jgi:CHAT domain-containing protein